MKQALNTTQTSAKEASWLTRLFSYKAPMHEEPPKKPEVCGVSYDWETSTHKAKEPRHQELLDIFDRWRSISEGTFSNEREIALFRLFGISDVVERVREYNREVCPSYGWGLSASDYSGETKGIMGHTIGIHLNRSGIDHFGVPIFDFELLSAKGATKALGDIRISVTASLKKKEGKDSDVTTAYYIFQGMRMLRHLEQLGGGENDWLSLAAAFPHVPVPGEPGPAASLSETEKLETGAFRTYMNKNYQVGRL